MPRPRQWEWRPEPPCSLPPWGVASLAGSASAVSGVAKSASAAPVAIATRLEVVNILCVPLVMVGEGQRVLRRSAQPIAAKARAPAISGMLPMTPVEAKVECFGVAADCGVGCVGALGEVEACPEGSLVGATLGLLIGVMRFKPMISGLWSEAR